MRTENLSLTERSQVARRLFELGFLAVAGARELAVACTAKVEQALGHYQAFWNLEVSGALDAATQEHLFRRRFCGLPDVLGLEASADAAALCQWAKSHLRVCINGRLPSLTDADFREAVMLALGWWQAESGLSFELVTDPRAADILITTGPIPGDGGPGGVLAQSELPCGHGGRRLTQLYDTRERYQLLDEMTGNAIDLARVVAHEIGHALGLGHTNVPAQLMNPTIHPKIRRPQPGWDIPEIRRRYPPPVNPPPTVPTPPAGELRPIVIQFPRPVTEITLHLKAA
jgi:hypothetical protein